MGQAARECRSLEWSCALSVDDTRAAFSVAQGAPDPIQQLQAHQLAQLQLVQMQQETLAAQVAQMRAAAKTLPNTAPPVGVFLALRRLVSSMRRDMQYDICMAHQRAELHLSY